MYLNDARTARVSEPVIEYGMKLKIIQKSGSDQDRSWEGRKKVPWIWAGVTSRHVMRKEDRSLDETVVSPSNMGRVAPPAIEQREDHS